MNEQTLVKIAFKLDPKEWHGFAVETVWAEQLNDSIYRIKNSPFYAFGINYLDEIEARPEDGMLKFVEIKKRSGHSTYRILFDSKKSQEEFLQYWQPIEELGCTYESSNGKMILYSVDIPPEADIKEIYSRLEKGQKEGAWVFEEGSYIPR